MSDAVANDFRFTLDSEPDIGVLIDIEITASWQLGEIDPPIVKSHTFVKFEVQSLFNSIELELGLIADPEIVTFVVD